MRPSQPQGFSLESYFRSDTIAAILTGGGGSVAIVRLSGDCAFKIACLLTQTKYEEWSPRTFQKISVYANPNKVLDHGLGVFFKAPRSYTGEDIFEFHLHGNQTLAKDVLRATLERGAKQALPGEFSFRAVRNGKQTILQAQAVADLIESKTEAGRTLALEKMSGTQDRHFQMIREQLLEMITNIEAAIDFSDQDLPEKSWQELGARISTLKDNLAFLLGTYAKAERIKEGIKTIVVGKPNVGKSSLFNALLGEERALVSSQPGTTRDYIGETLDLRSEEGQVTLRLIDTAGIRDASQTTDEIEKVGMSRALKLLKECDLVLWLTDCEDSEDVAPLDLDPYKTIGVITKADLKNENETRAARTVFLEKAISPVIVTSSQTGQGLDQLTKAIIERGSSLTRRADGEVWLTRAEQKKSIEEAYQCLLQSELSHRMKSHEKLASDLGSALRALSPFLGQYSQDDILGEIFSKFCIGK